MSTNLNVLAAKIRIATLKEIQHAKSGHVGGCMSIIETFAVLYGKQLKHDPKNPKWEERDYLVLSKGHTAPTWYATLAVRGFFEEELLYTLNQGGTTLPSHADRLKVKGVDMTSGSLGQGASVAAGIAYDLKRFNKDQYVFCIVGDGELDEGQNWEAFSFIAHHKLDNLIVIIDENKKQLDGYTKDILNPYCLVEKMKAWGFNTLKVDGSKTETIDEAITTAKAHKGQPTCIVLDTIKGQGIPYFEEMMMNHSVKFGDKDNQETEAAIARLQQYIKENEDV